jgi:hypothetical protein
VARLAILAAALVAGCTTTQSDSEPHEVLQLSGPYQKIAACAYQKADIQAPGGARIADLSALKEVQVSMGDHLFRYFVISFFENGPSKTRAEIRASPGTRGFVAIAREISQSCSG